MAIVYRIFSPTCSFDIFSNSVEQYCSKVAFLLRIIYHTFGLSTGQTDTTNTCTQQHTNTKITTAIHIREKYNNAGNQPPQYSISSRHTGWQPVRPITLQPRHSYSESMCCRRRCGTHCAHKCAPRYRIARAWGMSSAAYEKCVIRRRFSSHAIRKHSVCAQRARRVYFSCGWVFRVCVCVQSSTRSFRVRIRAVRDSCAGCDFVRYPNASATTPTTTTTKAPKETIATMRRAHSRSVMRIGLQPASSERQFTMTAGPERCNEAPTTTCIASPWHTVLAHNHYYYGYY